MLDNTLLPTKSVNDTPLYSSESSQIINHLKEDPEQFWRFWLTIEKRVFNYCFFRLTQNYHDAEDLCHETMLKAYENLPNAKDNTKLTGWLFQLARHIFFDQLRKKQTFNKYQIITSADDYSESKSSEEDEFLKQEFNANITEFITKLLGATPEVNRLVALDYFFSDKSYKQLGIEHNQTEANVRKIIFRTRKQLTPAVFKYINKSGT